MFGNKYLTNTYEAIHITCYLAYFIYKKFIKIFTIFRYKKAMFFCNIHIFSKMINFILNMSCACRLESNTRTVGAQSIARAQSIAHWHSTYVILPKKPKFRKFLFGKIKKEEVARRFFKKTVYFRV